MTSMECKHTCRYYREMSVMRLAVRRQCNCGSTELKLASASTTSVLEWKMLGLWIHNMVPGSNSSAKCISGSSASAATALQVKRKLTPAISLWFQMRNKILYGAPSQQLCKVHFWALCQRRNSPVQLMRHDASCRVWIKNHSLTA